VGRPAPQPAGASSPRFRACAPGRVAAVVRAGRTRSRRRRLPGCHCAPTPLPAGTGASQDSPCAQRQTPRVPRAATVNGSGVRARGLGVRIRRLSDDRRRLRLEADSRANATTVHCRCARTPRRLPLRARLICDAPVPAGERGAQWHPGGVGVVTLMRPARTTAANTTRAHRLEIEDWKRRRLRCRSAHTECLAAVGLSADELRRPAINLPYSASCGVLSPATLPAIVQRRTRTASLKCARSVTAPPRAPTSASLQLQYAPRPGSVSQSTARRLRTGSAWPRRAGAPVRQISG